MTYSIGFLVTVRNFGYVFNCAVKEGIWRNHRILSDSYIRDSVYYSIILQGWDSVKSKLQSLLER